MASQIVESVLREAEINRAKKVIEVRLIIGKLTFLGIEQVKFSFEILVKGTIMDHSKLVIEEREGVVKCHSCGHEGNLSYKDDPVYHVLTPTLNCPRCNEICEIVGGKECTIKSIQIEQEVARIDEQTT